MEEQEATINNTVSLGRGHPSTNHNNSLHLNSSSSHKMHTTDRDRDRGTVERPPREDLLRDLANLLVTMAVGEDTHRPPTIISSLTRRPRLSRNKVSTVTTHSNNSNAISLLR